MKKFFIIGLMAIVSVLVWTALPVYPVPEDYCTYSLTVTPEAGLNFGLVGVGS